MAERNIQQLEIETLKSVMLSKPYVEELIDLSAYGAHIKQERPMCYLLAKYLYKRGFLNLCLEKNLGKNQWCDMVVNNTKIEAKFYYESDLLKLEKEMNKFQWNIDLLRSELNSLKKEGKSHSWKVTLPIIEDIFEKNPDIFILIVLSRDLRKISVNVASEQISWGKYEKAYNEKSDFNNKYSLELAKKFFDCIRTKKNFVSDSITINVNKTFPSSYHVYFCDFRTQKN